MPPAEWGRRVIQGGDTIEKLPDIYKTVNVTATKKHARRNLFLTLSIIASVGKPVG
jgi:hypothetical protein